MTTAFAVDWDLIGPAKAVPLLQSPLGWVLPQPVETGGTNAQKTKGAADWLRP
jgi:hypothetical protein